LEGDESGILEILTRADFLGIIALPDWGCSLRVKPREAPAMAYIGGGNSHFSSRL